MLDVQEYLRPMNLIARKHFGTVSMATHSTLNSWSMNKSHFYDIFGGKTTVRSEEIILTENNQEEIEDSYSNFIDNLDYMIVDESAKRALIEYIDEAVGIRGFRDNKAIEQWTTTVNDKEVVINEGMKFSRSLRFFFPLDKELLREAQDLYSTYRQNFSSRKPGHLYLSIDPFDFLSMSDNNHNWSSCHELTDGEHRVGNYNLMADGVTLVGYYASEEDMDIELEIFGDAKTWNSKRWRVLIHAEEKDGEWVILYNKEYPFRSSKLMEELDLLLARTFGITENSSNKGYSKIDAMYPHLYQSKENTCTYLDLGSNAKYSRVRISDSLLEDQDRITPMTISEQVMCFECGGHVATRPHSGTCDFCADEFHCDWCGGVYPLGELEYVDSREGYACMDCHDYFFGEQEGVI